MKQEIKVLLMANFDFSGSIEKINDNVQYLINQYDNYSRYEFICTTYEDREHYNFYGFRLETDYEENNRKKQKLFINKTLEEHELKEYCRLKEKYGDK